MNIKQTFGKNLNFYRLQQGLTQKEMASKLNMVREQYGRYERGITELDYAKIISVCQILNITPNDLFEGCNNCNQ